LDGVLVIGFSVIMGVNIETYTFSGDFPGVKLLVLGAIHGNEKCGTKAIQNIIREIESGHLIVSQGSVTFLPISNPKAYIENKRFIDENLNRVFSTEHLGNAYEAALAKEIMDEIKQCDYILDIHSYTSGSGPFVFQDSLNEFTQDFISALKISPIFVGWEDMYEAAGGSYTTLSYAHQIGKNGATIECGQHNDPESVEIAYRTIKNALSFLKIINSPHANCSQPLQKIKMISCFLKRDGNLSRDWKNLDPVQEAEVIALLEDGENIVSPCNGFIIMPNSNAKIGEEWFYFGREL